MSRGSSGLRYYRNLFQFQDSFYTFRLLFFFSRASLKIFITCSVGLKKTIKAREKFSSFFFVSLYVNKIRNSYIFLSLATLSENVKEMQTFMLRNKMKMLFYYRLDLDFSHETQALMLSSRLDVAQTRSTPLSVSVCAMDNDVST